MEPHEIKNKLRDYDKLNKLYKDLISPSAGSAYFQPDVSITEELDTLKIKAFGKNLEVRFKMIIDDGISLGLISAFLLEKENCQPCESEICTIRFDKLGNFKSPQTLTSHDMCEENSLLEAVHLILENLIEKTIILPEELPF